MRARFLKTDPAPLLEGHLNLGSSSASGSIEVNSRYLVRDGRPWIPVMGEYHFSRDKAENWPRELAKMRAGGITVVATYLFWIYHEEEEGVFDFSGQNDVRAFVLACRDVGLEILLRIGPWAHGECRNGGFPEWIRHADYPTRCNDPRYLSKVKLWYGKLFGEVCGLLYKDGGPVIGIQLENEYVHDAEHLAKLKEISREVGFDVPLYTVTGWNSAAGARVPVNEVLPCFGGYCEAPWEQHTRPLPPSPHYFFHPVRNDSAIGNDLMIGAELLGQSGRDGWRLPYERYPFATCELGGGVQITHHRRPIVRPMDVYAITLTKLGCGSNLPGYYMFHGGTHQIRRTTMQESRATGYPNDYPILSYDFQAPLSEYGEVRDSYRLLNLLHLFLASFGDAFAPTVFQPAEVSPARDDAETLRYAMRVTEDGKSGFVFVNHYERRRKLADHEAVVFDTGAVVFPPVDMKGLISFFLPFGMKLGAERLTYATAQPLCREGNAFFFTEIPGIPAEYAFEDGTKLCAQGGTGSLLHKNAIRIVTLTQTEAKYVRRLGSALWIGNGCDLYERDGRILAAEDGEFASLQWTGEGFETVVIGKPAPEVRVEAEVMTDAPFPPAYPEELSYGGERKLTWMRLTVTANGECGENTLVTVPVLPERYDAAQIYADGQMIADSFDCGMEWKIPAGLLIGRECAVVFSEPRDDFYREFG